MLMSLSCLIEMRGAFPSADSDILSLLELSGAFDMMHDKKHEGEPFEDGSQVMIRM